MFIAQFSSLLAGLPQNAQPDALHLENSAIGIVNDGNGPIEGMTFPQGAVHMLHNTGSQEMKVVCFFAPPTNLSNYKLYEDVDFPEGVKE